MNYPKTLAVLLLALLVNSSLAAAEQFALTINVSGAVADQGQVICSLFSSADNYLKQPLADQTQPVDNRGKAVCHFSQLHAGTYAASVIYDQDQNGELNTGLLGIPTELVGMSNNVKSLFGPPSFKKTSFTLSASMYIDILLTMAKE